MHNYVRMTILPPITILLKEIIFMFPQAFIFQDHPKKSILTHFSGCQDALGCFLLALKLCRIPVGPINNVY